MRAGEHKVGLQIVIEAPERPVRGVVTGLALGAQPTSMHVFRRMTPLTILYRIMERRRGVAGLTTDRGVCPDQREVRQTVIESHVAHPRDLGMTGVTLAAQLTHMGVIGVAPGAVHGQAHIRPFHMAGGALQLVVCTEKWETLDLTVIESGASPVGDPVTTTAIGSETTLVHVV